MTVQNILRALQSGNVENAAQEARWIVKYGKGDLNEITRRRVNGEPLQYLLGEWEFYGEPFKVGKGALIPRPETELLVDAALAALARENFSGVILDLCAGTGCVGIVLAQKTGRDVIAVEKSARAMRYLEENIKLNRVQNKVKAVRGDALDRALMNRLLPPDREFSVVMNPPYLSDAEMASLQKEVAHEPNMALYGGKDGLDFYREFFRVWGERLKQARLFACETGDGQASAICGLMREIGVSAEVKRDFNGIDRVVLIDNE